MSTNINITVGDEALLARAKQQQSANRQAQLERESSTRLEAEATAARTTSLAAVGKDANGNSLTDLGFKIPQSERRPAANRFGSNYFWLAVRAWWFDIDTFNDVPPPGKDLADIGKVTNVYIQGDGGTTTYQTIGEGGDSVLNLLNGRDSSYDTYYDFPFLPLGVTAPTNPYLSQMAGPRKTLEATEPPAAAFDPTKYTILSTNQLPIFQGGTLTFHKPFYNIYLETLDTTQVAIATQPKKFSTSGSLQPQSATYHGVTFNPNNSTLFDVNHAYLIGKYETGISTVKPIGTSNTVHVFIRTGRDRNGFYSLLSSGTSRFSVGDVVYWHNRSLYLLEASTYRYGTITSISRGTFTYPNNTGGSRSVTGLRVVIELSTDLTLDFNQLYELFDSTIVKPFSSVGDALSSPDSLWVDQLRSGGGFFNEWVVETTEGRALSVPQLFAEFLGDSFLQTEQMDCSKNGKAYFIQSAVLSRDTPQWRRQDNYHDGDVVAQRPGNIGEGSDPYTTKSIIVRFLELNCASNRIERSVTTELEFPATSNPDAATIQAMPAWFPSKRYRQAGFFSTALNLNRNETKASRLSTTYDVTTETERYYIKSWPLDQSLPIGELVEMLFAEADYDLVEITSSLAELDTPIPIPASAGPSRWGYSYTTGYLVSL